MIPARRDPIVDVYHGVAVPDPYRWLEDPDSPDTVAFVDAQNRRTRAALDSVPARAVAQERLLRLWNYPRYSVPFRKGDRYFFSKNDGLQNQAVLYVQDALDAPARVALDPNTLSDDGTVALTNLAVSKDGAMLAYGLSASGSDWQTIHVRRVDSGEDFADALRWIKFTSIAWRPDGSGFYYTRHVEPGTVPVEEETFHQRVMFHPLGAAQDDDTLVYARPDLKEWSFTPAVTEDGRYLLLYGSLGTDPRNRLYYRPIDSTDDFIRLLDDADASYQVIDAIDSTLYVQTDCDAPKGRIIAIDLTSPERDRWREIIPESSDTIDYVAIVNNRLVVVTLRDARHVMTIVTLDGAVEREIPLPGIGSVGGLSGKRGDTAFFFAFTSFLFPTTIFRYDFLTDTVTPFRQSEVAFDPTPYQTTQVFVTSSDGARVPIFITARRDAPRDGSNPTLLYGYGGFNVSLTPFFQPELVPWFEAGGVYVVANLRGGGEYGEAWHQAGMLANKQNVFNDFLAAAEWLIANGYTRPDKLAIQGGSNGGLLVAACMTQRPDRFGAVICQVPVTDMLRYHKPIGGLSAHAGRYWIPEYGNADEDPDLFRAILAYSPLHNVRDGVRYPPILIMTADHDDRVVPAHSLKFAARLQAADTENPMILLRVETKAGHGAGKPLAKVIEEDADIYAFLARAIGVAFA